MRVLVTGGCGFIGSTLVRLLHTDPATHIVNLDALTYAADPARLGAIQASPRHTLVRGDVADATAVARAMAGADVVLHLAAESHVDNAIADTQPFLRTNVIGTQVILEAARDAGVQHVIHVSTDEVYGDLPADAAPLSEAAPLAPSNPYAASKASADLLCLAAARTWGVPVSITRGTNTYGPQQHREKLIPTLVAAARAGRALPLYGDGLQVRDWLHVDDHCRAILHVLTQPPGQIWHVGARNEQTNRALAQRVLELVGVQGAALGSVTDRLGHDRRYALDPSKLQATGWAPRTPWASGFAQTVRTLAGELP